MTSQVQDALPTLTPTPSKPYSIADVQALEDAITFRAARLRRPCSKCKPDSLCDPHYGDQNLVDVYHQMLKAANAAHDERDQARAPGPSRFAARTDSGTDG